MSKKYRNYFQINESYFPAVNEDVIKTKPDVWKSYYPHESFIKLLNQTKSVLTNNQRMSIWVEGAYGTGKSHAVLTLKELLDCSNEELKEYFDKYNSVLSKDLYNDFYSIKNQNKKVLTVHRYGSSDIKNDQILMESIQDSIITALEKNNYSYKGQIGIKQGMINWLSNDDNRKYFNSIIQSDDYKIRFGGANADTILENLKNYSSDKALRELIEKISEVGEDKGIKPFVLKKEDLKTWILDVIDKNNLKAIFFIWDEFSDYFNKNKGNLSGFQFLIEMSESHPFYFVIVTHKSDIFFENSKDDVKTKINGRFISPHCTIELPDNMAFILTAHAMQKVEDPAILADWNQIVDDLYELTHDSRNEVIKTAKITEKELKGVLPIHPYAALVLKHIASAFDSNQRSMFDFIKNDRGDEIKGFQWYIDNCGPDDDNSLLTVDLLWDFFYEKGKDQLAPQIKAILDVYSRIESHKLLEPQKRVLKTLLLLQAINEKVGDTVSLFIPNAKNLGLAFEGTDINQSNAVSLAQGLVREQIIFERPMGGGQVKYSALISNGNLEEIEKEKEKIKREIRTDKLIEEAEFVNEFNLPKSIEIRYPGVKFLTYENIKSLINSMKADSENHPTRLYAAFTFARTADEGTKIRNEIKKAFDGGFEKIVFIDYSDIVLSNDNYNQYVDSMANSNYQRGKDLGQSKTFAVNAKEALRKWKIQIKVSSPRVFTYYDQNGSICNTLDEAYQILRELNKDNFTYALENHLNVIDTMYLSTALKQGAECGAKKELKGTFKSANPNTSLEAQLAEIWNLDRYWEIKPNEFVSKIKKAVEKVINEKFTQSSRVSISDIYSALSIAPFGFMPCNLSAFVLGFVLRDYANDSYNYTDEVTTVPMSFEKLSEMISEVIKNQQTPNPRYKEKYIVQMSSEQREFNKSTSIVFHIDETKCSSIENTRSYVRNVMTSFEFPIWTLKYYNFNSVTDKNIVLKTIDLYVELANNINSSRSETDVALEIGKLYIEHNDLASDLEHLLKKDNCREGMIEYLKVFENGILINCAKEIGDTGLFVNEISKKFSDATNWVWNKNTVDEKISETIIEYEIVRESNKLIIKTSNYNDCLKEWAKKCSTFKVAYYSVKDLMPDISDFLSVLYQNKKNGYIYTADKESFLNDLKNKSELIKQFCENQISMFKKVCTRFIDGLTDSDISELISNYVSDVFICENSEYLNRVEEWVKQYKASMSKYKLALLWKEKTGSISPIKWSDEYSMPILCMVDAKEQEKARSVFETINSQTNDKAKIDDAIDYLEKCNFLSSLKNSEKRENSFRLSILKNYSSIIEDIDELKKEIKVQCPGVNPYYWLGNKEVENFINQYAYKFYLNGGSEKANSIIDSMNADELRKYLKELIKDNMNVGIGIISDKK